VHYAGVTGRLARFAERHGIPVAETQAGKGALSWGHNSNVGAIGVTGTSAANALARDADVVLAVGDAYRLSAAEIENGTLSLLHMFCRILVLLCFDPPQCTASLTAVPPGVIRPGDREIDIGAD
jgi:glyoxylate carboligase